MRTEELLAGLATGLWRWDRVAGRLHLDAEAARLFGLPPEPTAVSDAVARARFHPVDFAQVNGSLGDSLLDRPAEVRLRIVDERGAVRRVIRSRFFAVSRPEGPADLHGMSQEVPETETGPESSFSPAVGDWRRSREAFLLDAGRELAEARSTQDVLRVAAGLSLPGFTPEGLVVFGPEGGRLRTIGWHGYTKEDKRAFMDLPLDSEYPAAEVMRTGRPLYLASPQEYQSHYPTIWPMISHFDRNSWAYLPLVHRGAVIGVWMAAFRHPVSFTPDERSVLTTVARMMAAALARAGEQESQYELSMGLQRSMMPAVRQDLPGLRLAARYVPTGGGLEIGGDWYDVIALPSGRTALVIGDVQGHDVRAAGIMGQLRIALRAYAAEGHPPDAVLTRASHFLSDINDTGFGRSDPRFATCLYAEVDARDGLLHIARAGHPDPLVRMVDGTLLARPTAGGLPLGLMADADYPVTRLGLEPGETLLMCTDGLLETGGHDMDSGWARLRRAIEGFDASRAGPGAAEPVPTEFSPDRAGTPDGAAGDLDALADALVDAVIGPASHRGTGPLAAHREDDVALVLLAREGQRWPEDMASGLRGRQPSRRAVMTVAQTEPDRIAAARRQLRDMLHDWADRDQVDSAQLMVSEVITNVLTHTDADALLVAEISGPCGRRRLRVDVADASEELPHRRSPGELASSGRGLVLLESMAGAWGVDPRGAGKSTWFELYEDAPAPATAPSSTAGGTAALEEAPGWADAEPL
ncbi:SpoIIE family protein phosphatase [Streptomyces sp. NPDC059740]|uniref:ATP-binding SpoIIE family protein phosphatase n=1 Tax=Streptomyces sp. NPDC059740 TaxID=3346926 RepID=UPI0036659462